MILLYIGLTLIIVFALIGLSVCIYFLVLIYQDKKINKIRQGHIEDSMRYIKNDRHKTNS